MATVESENRKQSKILQRAKLKEETYLCRSWTIGGDENFWRVLEEVRDALNELKYISKII